MYKSLVVTVMFLLITATGNTVELSIPSQEVESGQSVSIPLIIDAVDNLAGFRIFAKYDHKILTFKTATKTRQTSSLMHIVNSEIPGELVIVLAGAKGITGKNFTIMNLTFQVLTGIKKMIKTEFKINKIEMMDDKIKFFKCGYQLKPLIIKPAKSKD